jgi:ATP-grasp domain, R2K clade family 3
MPRITWVLEAEVFPESHDAMRAAALEAGHEVLVWQDEWWMTGRWPRLSDQSVIFHGSLGNADRIRKELPWTPGAYCDTRAFHCTSWYPRAQRWLLHQNWRILPAATLAADPKAALVSLGGPDSVFVRPDSPLKPFSGRVLRGESITLKALDHGFYYDDEQLPVVIAPVRTVTQEWRYVVINNRIVAGSAYTAANRAALPDDPAGEPWRFASTVAEGLEPPEDVYVMDICRGDSALQLLELNPFSGADLYACNRTDVVRAISAVAR